MSTGAKVFQLIFVVIGLFFIGIGALGVAANSGEQKSSAEWTCKPDTDSPTTSVCTQVGSANGDLLDAIGFVLVGIGLEATAAAVAAGSRPTPVQPYPAMQPARPTPWGPAQATTGPMPTGPAGGAQSGPGYPATPQQPPWPS